MPKLLCPVHLEVKSQLGRHRTGRNVVCAAEGRQEVVERHFVRQIDGCKPQTPLVSVAMEEVVVAHARVKQIARSDARRVFVIILGSRLRNADQARSVLRCRAQIGTEA